MTPNEIRAAIAASSSLQALVPDTVALADALSEGRTRANGRMIGNGTILETIGLAAGNALLDAIASNAAFRYVKPLLEQGRLIAGSPLVAGALAQLVQGGVITQAHADALATLGREPDPVDEFSVRCAIFNDDGSLRSA